MGQIIKIGNFCGFRLGVSEYTFEININAIQTDDAKMLSLDKAYFLAFLRG